MAMISFTDRLICETLFFGIPNYDFAVCREVTDEAAHARKRIVCSKMAECLRVIENCSAQISKVMLFCSFLLLHFRSTSFFQFAVLNDVGSILVIISESCRLISIAVY